jgi:acyl carrier protein
VARFPWQEIERLVAAIRPRWGVKTMSAEISKKVIEIISNQLEIEADKIKAELSFTDDLKADSLAVVELVLALEETFGIEIPDEDTEKIRTVQDAITYIETHSK